MTRGALSGQNWFPEKLLVSGKKEEGSQNAITNAANAPRTVVMTAADWAALKIYDVWDMGRDINVTRRLKGRGVI